MFESKKEFCFSLFHFYVIWLGSFKKEVNSIDKPKKLLKHPIHCDFPVRVQTKLPFISEVRLTGDRRRRRRRRRR